MKVTSPMKTLATACVLTALLGAGALAHAQTADKKAASAKKATTAQKAPAKKATPAKKTTAKKKVAPRTARAVESVTPVQTLTQRLTDTELALAQNVQTGRIQCGLGADVTVTADEKNPGFFHVASGKQRYYMHPVESRTGALRLEDNRAGALWLQLGNKSMLMNQKLGQRVADDCQSSAQRDFAAQMQSNPQPSLLGDK